MRPQKYRAIGYESPTLSKAPDISIEDYCTSQGLELVTFFRDDDGNKHLELTQRPAGRQLFGACRRYKAKNIVAANLYSLFKDTVDAGRQMPRWLKMGVRLHLLNFAGHPYVIEGEVGRTISLMVETLGKMERANRRERIGSSLAKRKVRGFVYGPTPYGFYRDGSLLVEHQKERLVIKRMRKLKNQ